MAAVIINKTKIPRNTFVARPATVAVNGTDGATVAFDCNDASIVLTVENTSASAKTCTIKAGNGFAGVNDLVMSLAPSTTYNVVVESGRFVNTSGPMKGMINIKGTDTTVKVAAIVVQ